MKVILYVIYVNEKAEKVEDMLACKEIACEVCPAFGGPKYVDIQNPLSEYSVSTVDTVQVNGRTLYVYTLDKAKVPDLNTKLCEAFIARMDYDISKITERKNAFIDLVMDTNKHILRILQK